MTTTQTRAAELQAGDLLLTKASDGIRYALLITRIEYHEPTDYLSFDVAESVHESTFGLTWDCRLAYKPSDLLDKLEGIAA